MENKFASVCFWLFLVCCGVADAALPKSDRKADFEVFSNYSTPFFSFLDDIFYHLQRNNSNVTESCRLDTEELLRLANSGDTQALKVFDASGKPSSGILEGGLFFIGLYSECVQTVVSSGHRSLRGRYCLFNLKVPRSSQQQILPPASWLAMSQGLKPPNIGLCVPRSCTKDDVEFATNAGLKDNFEDITGTVATCHEDALGLSKDGAALFALCFFISIFVLATVATSYDIYWNWRRNKAALTHAESTDTAITTVSSVTDIKKLTQEQKAEGDSVTGPGRGVQLLLAFSLKNNISKIFSVGESSNIGCVNGLKCLSMLLIIVGHTFSFAAQNLFFNNPTAASDAPKGFVSQIFANGTLAVDTFYLISGILVAYVTLKTLGKLKGKFPFLLYYVHRYFRLTPLMMAVIFFCATLLKYVGDGPNWLKSIEMYDDWCKRNWWTNALYLNNFINLDTMCLSHSWYLATDMQMYIIAPLLLIPLYKSRKWGLIISFIFLLITIVTTAIITAINHYPAIPYINNIVPNEVVIGYYHDVYMMPFCRIGPYIVGIIIGYLFIQEKERVIKRSMVALGWSLSVLLGTVVLFSMWPANAGHLPSNAEATLYSALARTVWGCSVGWLVYACFYGYGGPVNSILSWGGFVPISRLTYCAYLIHPVVMNVYYGTMESPVVFSAGFTVYTSIGNVLITYLISIILCALFESPFITIEKVLLKR